MDHFKITNLTELSERMTVEDFFWWLAYCELEGPLGSMRADMRAGSICQVMAATIGGKGTLRDYTLSWRPKAKTSWDQIAGYFDSLIAVQKPK